MITETRAQLIAELVGTDDNPGVLDRYQVGHANGLVFWVCRRDHVDSGAYVHAIARNLDGDQTGLTLGEMVQAALEHEDEAHGEVAE